LALLAVLTACGERPQSLGGARQDAAAYTGGASAFAAKGWTPGDKTSWEQQLRSRAQNTQNDYAKAN
jgi:hypothetical protein